MNTELAKGTWNEVKGEIQQTWAAITDNELEQTRGDMTAIKGLIQKKYGMDEEVSEKLAKIAGHFVGTKPVTLPENDVH